jgi:hypothetical protein
MTIRFFYASGPGVPLEAAFSIRVRGGSLDRKRAEHMNPTRNILRYLAGIHPNRNGILEKQHQNDHIIKLCFVPE